MLSPRGTFFFAKHELLQHRYVGSRIRTDLQLGILGQDCADEACRGNEGTSLHDDDDDVLYIEADKGPWRDRLGDRLEAT